MPRNCGSSWAYACRRARCGATCRVVGDRAMASRRSSGAPSCATMPRRSRLRFLRDHHSDVSHTLRLCRPRRRHAPDRALERDRAFPAEWTVQQFRGIVPGDQPQRFLIHDRDSIYSAAVDDAVRAMGLTVLKTPVRCPQANGFCERLIGTIRRECLDWLIVLNERQLRCVLRGGWVTTPGGTAQQPRAWYSRHTARQAGATERASAP